MSKEDLLMQLELLQDADVSVHALYGNGYSRGVSDALELVKQYFDSEGWISFKGNEILFNIEAKKNCLCLFSDGTTLRYKEEHPTEIMTHFKLANK